MGSLFLWNGLMAGTQWKNKKYNNLYIGINKNYLLKLSFLSHHHAH
jgi:outer membrane scaffolding protein for murein synthesis (MipA/OmpV family)